MQRSRARGSAGEEQGRERWRDTVIDTRIKGTSAVCMRVCVLAFLQVHSRAGDRVSSKHGFDQAADCPREGLAELLPRQQPDMQLYR